MKVVEEGEEDDGKAQPGSTQTWAEQGDRERKADEPQPAFRSPFGFRSIIRDGYFEAAAADDSA